MPVSCARPEVRPDFPPTGAFPLVYVVILNFNRADLTVNCLQSVLKVRYPNFKVAIVDNGSADDSVLRLKAVTADPRVELLLNDRNEGYAGGNNRGIEKALSDGAAYVFVLNNDTLVEPGCLDSLVTALEADPRIAVAGCEIEDARVKSAPNRGQRISLFTGDASHWGHDDRITSPVDVDFICGAAIILRAKALREIGGFDSRLFSYYEDADFCFRARKAGYRACFVPGPGVRHLTSATASVVRNRAMVCLCLCRNRIWFIRRHGNLLHRVVSTLLSFCYRYPKALLAHIARGEFNLLAVTLKAIWAAYTTDECES
jgi:GT2 family glycosyltransferase